MSSLTQEIEEIIDYAKGNFFPTSLILKHALVVAKKIGDKEFEEFIVKELKGYKTGPLPAHRRLRGQVAIMPRFGPFQTVTMHNLDDDAVRKVSTAYVAETVPIIENTLNFEGDNGSFTAGFSPQNGGVLPPIPTNQAQYGILLANMQLRELLDDVRTMILDWAIRLQSEMVGVSEKNRAAVETQTSKNAKGSPIQYMRENKQWIFSGIGVLALSLFVGAIVYVFKSHEPNPATYADTRPTTQRGFVEIPETKTYEVFYPQSFTSVPNLTFSKMVDSVYTPVDYEVLDQRRDGFKIRINAVGGARTIEWIAVGPTK